MLTKEQYNNLSSQINYAHMTLESIIANEYALTNGEEMARIIDVKKTLEEIQDIIDFLVVNNGVENK